MGPIPCDNPEQHSISNTISVVSPRCNANLRLHRAVDASLEADMNTDSDDEVDVVPTQVGSREGQLQFHAGDLLTLTTYASPDELASCVMPVMIVVHTFKLTHGPPV